MDALIYLMFLGLLIYALIGFLVTFGIMRVSGRKKQSISANGSNPSVSVIVAVRNEEDNIPDLMDCLLSQSYENYEVIIVDDNSTDSTRAVAEKRIIGKNSVTIDGRSTTRVNVIPAKENLLNWGPKKNALHTGIEFSKGEIILTTDADCRPSKDWIKEIVSCYEDGVGCVAGYTKLESARPGFLEKLKGLEGLAMAIIAMSFIGLKKPYIAGGGNFSYRKELYKKLGGFGENAVVAAGDDDLLVQKASKLAKVSYATSGGSVVRSVLKNDHYIDRKKRHIAVTKHYSFEFIALGAIVFAFISVIFISLLWSLLTLDVIFLKIVLVVFLLKILVDIFVLDLGSRLLNDKYNLFEVLFTEFLVFPYTLILQPLSFIGKIKWKDRSLCTFMTLL
ncbi:MAG: glycosyltransferase [Ignavibacteria bacterium]|jgi:glycosyltransferase involved in cell wall biosynthesis|nr:glycosyltransferase [Ignavibacteria bacterium]MCU7501805.1 glycosyltransferase [Ignavibacteria bacterium]MCU7518274.1 glycosyltransferase [Ignavibacteria bacterium]